MFSQYVIVFCLLQKLHFNNFRDKVALESLRVPERTEVDFKTLKIRILILIKVYMTLVFHHNWKTKGNAVFSQQTAVVENKPYHIKWYSSVGGYYTSSTAILHSLFLQSLVHSLSFPPLCSVCYTLANKKIAVKVSVKHLFFIRTIGISVLKGKASQTTTPELQCSEYFHHHHPRKWLWEAPFPWRPQAGKDSGRCVCEGVYCLQQLSPLLEWGAELAAGECGNSALPFNTLTFHYWY